MGIPAFYFFAFFSLPLAHSADKAIVNVSVQPAPAPRGSLFPVSPYPVPEVSAGGKAGIVGLGPAVPGGPIQVPMLEFLSPPNLADLNKKIPPFALENCARMNVQTKLLDGMFPGCPKVARSGLTLPEKIQCEDFKLPGGGFDNASYTKAKEGKYKQSLLGLKCLDNRTDVASRILPCLERNQQRITAYINALKGYYAGWGAALVSGQKLYDAVGKDLASQLGRMTNYISTFEKYDKDLKDAIEEVTKDWKQASRARDELKKLGEEIALGKKQRVTKEKEIAQQKALACFTSPSNESPRMCRDPLTGEVANRSPSDFIICQFKSAFFVNSRGEQRRKGAQSQSAEQALNAWLPAVKSRLDSMFGEIDGDQVLPTADQVMSQIQDFFNQVGTEIIKQGGKDPALNNLIRSEYGNCEKRAEYEIQKSKKSGELFAIDKKIREDEKAREVKREEGFVEMTNSLKKYSDLYQRLFFDGFGVKTNEMRDRICTADRGDMAKIAECMSNLHENLKAMHDGGQVTPSKSGEGPKRLPNFQIDMKTQFHQTSLDNLRCNSVARCLADLKERREQTAEQATRIGDAKARYIGGMEGHIQGLNQQISDEVGKMAAILNVQLGGHVRELMQEVLGESFSSADFECEPIKAEEAESIDMAPPPGLKTFKPPKDFVAFFGGNSSPPMCQTKKGGWASLADNLAKEGRTTKAELAKFTEIYDSMDDQMKKCVLLADEELTKKIVEILNANEGCAAYIAGCDMSSTLRNVAGSQSTRGIFGALGALGGQGSALDRLIGAVGQSGGNPAASGGMNRSQQIPLPQGVNTSALNIAFSKVCSGVTSQAQKFVSVTRLLEKQVGRIDAQNCSAKIGQIQQKVSQNQITIKKLEREQNSLSNRTVVGSSSSVDSNLSRTSARLNSIDSELAKLESENSILSGSLTNLSDACAEMAGKLGQTQATCSGVFQSYISGVKSIYESRSGLSGAGAR